MKNTKKLLAFVSPALMLPPVERHIEKEGGSMKTHYWLLGLALSFAVTTAAIAYEQWDTAMKTSESPTGDPMLTKCHYETNTGYKFSIVVRGMCPYIVKINPETGKVKTQ